MDLKLEFATRLLSVDERKFSDVDVYWTPYARYFR